MNIKKFLLIASMVIMSMASIFAQAPQGFTYQAVVRISPKHLLANTLIGVRISILQGSSTGNVVYSEEYRPKTNENGLFSIVIGEGTNSIEHIDWSNGPYFLQSEIDPNGGHNYTLNTIQQMFSVPYALHAKTASNVSGGINYDSLTNKPTLPTKVSDLANDAGYLTSYTETQVLSKNGDTLFLTGGSYVVLPAGFSGNYNDLTNKPNLFSGNYNDLSNTPKLFSGNYDSLTNKPTLPTKVSDLSNDAGYLTSYTETQVLSKNGDTLFLTGGSYVVLPAGFSGNYNDLSNKPKLFSGNYDSLTNKPTLPTKVSDLTNDAGYLTSYTESQVLSKRGDTLFLTGGSYVVLSAGFSGNYNDLTNKPNLFSGNYNDLSNKPKLFSGNYDSLTNKPTNISYFTNDAGYLTSYTETQVLSKNGDTLFLTGGSYVVLPAGFSGNYNDLTNKPNLFSGNYNDLSNKPKLFSGNYDSLTNKPAIPTKVSDLTNDAGYLTSYTETQVLSKNGDTLFLTGGSYVVLPAGFSGNYNDLTNKPNLFSGNYNDLTNKPTIPNKVSDLSNDAGYLTSYTETQVLSKKGDTLFLTGGSYVVLPAGFSGNYNDLTNKPNLFSGNYNDLSNKPKLFSGNYDSLTNKPANVSAFTNDAGYLTSYTETQVLSKNGDTLFLTGGSYVVLPAGFSGNYNDLINKPNLFSGIYDSLTNKPTLFSGDYDSLTNKPTNVSA
ncbi:MAG: hypothetical protein J5606_06520, partial [Bacteroidales bacterium]|nr:hypothetical protein [Bacteroidales bacterium]